MLCEETQKIWVNRSRGESLKNYCVRRKHEFYLGGNKKSFFASVSYYGFGKLTIFHLNKKFKKLKGDEVK